MTGPELVIVHLYPELLGTYGDRGNVLVLRRRAEWRGLPARVVRVGRGEPIPADARIVLIGGGTDRIQEVVSPDLLERAGELTGLAGRGCVILGVCGGYQLLGREYVSAEGTVMAGLGLLDISTVAGEDRLIGRVLAEASLWGRTVRLAGFENHGGRTRLGPRAAPLATVTMGGGNNGSDRSEGAVTGTVLGTYLHGPVLAANVHLADLLLRRAIFPTGPDAGLVPLDDAVELDAHRAALALRR